MAAILSHPQCVNQANDDSISLILNPILSHHHTFAGYDVLFILSQSTENQYTPRDQFCTGCGKIVIFTQQIILRDNCFYG